MSPSRKSPSSTPGTTRRSSPASHAIFGSKRGILAILSIFGAHRDLRRFESATETQYALDRLGMSRSAVRQRITQTRRARWLDGLDAAVQEGRIDPSHASAMARVATPDTLEAWIERATRRTYKHLLEEVQLAELLVRVGGGDAVEPPSDDEVAEWHRVEADWLSGAFVKEWSTQIEEELVSGPVEMIEGAGDEPYVQRGAHLEEVDDALAAACARVGSAAWDRARPRGRSPDIRRCRATGRGRDRWRSSPDIRRCRAAGRRRG